MMFLTVETQPRQRTGQDYFNLSFRAKPPAALQQAAHWSDAVPAAARLPLPPSTWIRLRQRSRCTQIRGGLSHSAHSALDTTQPHPGLLLMPVVLQGHAAELVSLPGSPLPTCTQGMLRSLGLMAGRGIAVRAHYRGAATQHDRQG